MLEKNNRFNYGVDSGRGDAQNLSNLQNAYPSSRHFWFSMGVKGAVLGLGLATLLPLTAFAEGPAGYEWNWPTAPTVGGIDLDTVDVIWKPVQPTPAVTPPLGIHLPYGTPINDDLVLEGQIEVRGNDGSIIVDKDHPGTGKFQFVVEKVLYPVSKKPYSVFAYYFLDPDKAELKTDDYDGCAHQYLYVEPAVAELEWDTPEAITYGTPLSDTQLNAKCVTIDVSTIGTAAGGPNGKILEGTFTYKPAAGEVLDATQTKDGDIILPPGTHTLKVTFTPSNPNYLEAEAEVELIVYPADLTDDQFSWDDQTLNTLTYGDTFTVDNIHYTRNNDVTGTISTEPDMLNTQPNAGEYPLVLTFTPDNKNYKPSIKDDAKLIVKKAEPVIEWDTPARVEKGTLFARSASAAGIVINADGEREAVTGNFTYDPAFPVTLNQVPEQTLAVTFTPTGDSAVNYKEASATRTVQVYEKMPVTLKWETPYDISYGTPLVLGKEEEGQLGEKCEGIQLNALAMTADGTHVDGRYVYIPEAGKVLPKGTHELKVTFTPVDTDVYARATNSVWINVTNAVLTIAIDKKSIKYNQDAPDYTYEITGFVDGDTIETVFGTNPPVATSDYVKGDADKGNVGKYNIVLTDEPVVANYAIKVINNVLTVEPADLTPDEFSWNPAAPLDRLTYGDTFTVDNIHYTATVQGTVTTEPAMLETLPNAGRYPLVLTFNAGANYNPATEVRELIVDKATPRITWEPVSPIIYGTLLSEEQLNATFSWTVDGQEVTVDGAATYNHILNEKLPAGSQTLTLVSFVPDDANNYNNVVDVTRNIEVTPLVLKIVVDDKNIKFNEPAPDYTYQIIEGELVEGDVLLIDLNSNYTPGDPVTTDENKYFIDLSVVNGNEATPGVVPGTYVIDAGNYVIEYTRGELIVEPKEADIIWIKPDPIIQGTPLVQDDNQRGIKVDGVQLNALAVQDKNQDPLVEIPGTYIYTPAAGYDALPVGENTLAVTFTPNDTNYKAATATVVLLVQIKPVIIWADPQEIDYTNEKGERSKMQTLLTAIITEDGTKEGTDVSNLGNFRYTWTQSGNEIKPTASTLTPEAGTYRDWLKVEFLLDPTAINYAQPDPVIVDLIVNQGTPVIAWNPDAKGPVTTPLPGMEIPVPPVYQLPDINYGTELTDADQLNAYVCKSKTDTGKSNMTGTMIYTVPATKLQAGWNTLYVTFTPTGSYAKNYKAVTVFNLIYVKHTELDKVVWNKPTNITYGTALTLDQFEGPAGTNMYGLAGTNNVYGTSANQNPALGAILSAGEHKLTATFVPDDTNYNRKDATQTLTVDKANPQVTIGMEPTNPDEIIEIDYGTLVKATDPIINASAKGYDGSELEGDFAFAVSEYDPDTDNYVPVDTDPTEMYLNVKVELPEGKPQYKLKVIFTPTGDDAGNYNKVEDVEKYLNVLPVEPTVEVAMIDPIPYGEGFTSDFLLSVTTVKGVKTEDETGYETVKGAEGTPEFFIDDIPFGSVDTKALATGTHNLRVVFTPAADEVNYVVANGETMIDIYGSVKITWLDPLDPTVEWPNSGKEIVYGTELTDAYFQTVVTDAETGAEVSGTKKYSIVNSEIPAQAGIVLDAGTYYLKVKFTPENTADYDPAEKEVKLVVTGKNPHAQWFPFPMFYGQTPGDNQYNARADVSGSFDYPEEPVWPKEAGEYDLNAPFTPEDPNYSKVDPVIGHLVILKAPVYFEWPAKDMNYGDTPTDADQFNAKAYTILNGKKVEVEGTFIYPRSELTDVTAGGIYTLVAPWTPKDNRNYESGIAYANIEVLGADVKLTWNPPTLSYGDTVKADQLNAKATFNGEEVPGEYVYMLDGKQVKAGDVITALGNHTMSVTFTPDSGNYNITTETDPVDVEPGTPSVKFYEVVPDDEEGKDPTYEELDKIELAYGEIMKVNEDGTITITTETEEDEEGDFVIEEETTIKVIAKGIIKGVDDNTEIAGEVTFTLDGVDLTKLEQPLDPKEDPYKLTATFTSENANYANGTASIDVSVEVEEGAVEVDWDVYDNYPWSEGLVWGDITGKTADAWNAYTGEWLAGGNDLTYTIDGAVFDLNAPVEVGIYYLKASYEDPVYGYGEDNDKITIWAATPTLVANKLTFTYGTILYPGSFDCHAYGTEGNDLTGAVDFYVNDVPLGEVNQPLPIGEYALTVEFTPDNANYKSVELVEVLTVLPNGEDIVVTWDVPVAITFGEFIELNATAIDSVTGTILAQGDELIYNINEDGVVLPEGAELPVGIYQVKAIFLGAGEYEGIEKDTGWLFVTVDPVLPTLSWNPAPLTYGTAATSAQENATANAAGQFIYPDMSGLPAGQNQVTATFISGDPNFADGEVSAILEVTKATPVINWATPAPITYGTALSGEQLNASANVEGSFEYTPAAGTELEIGDYTLFTVFTPTDTANYTTATAKVELTVIPGVEPEITWDTPEAITYGTPLSAVQLNATANVEGSFFYNPTFGTVLSGGIQKLTVIFKPTQKGYKTLYKEVFIEVMKLQQTINFEPIGVVEEGDVVELFATTSTQLPVRFISNNEEVAVIDGNIMTIVGSGTAVITAIQDGNENYDAVSAEQTITVDSTVPTINISRRSLTRGGGNTVVITFTGTLEESTDGVTWTPVVGAEGSIEVDIDVASKKFYRSVK